MAEAMCSSSKLPEYVKVSLKGSQALSKSDNTGAVKRSLHEGMTHACEAGACTNQGRSRVSPLLISLARIFLSPPSLTLSSVEGREDICEPWGRLRKRFVSPGGGSKFEALGVAAFSGFHPFM